MTPSMPGKFGFVGTCAVLGVCLAIGCGMLSAAAARADEPLHEQIDRLIEADAIAPVAPPASDQEFLRRASLDLIGRIPSPAEAREFANDPSPDKRSTLVDRLLASPEYARHMATVFDVALMERRAEKSVPIADWQRYLHESFAANKPYDQLVREILSADGADPGEACASAFLSRSRRRGQRAHPRRRPHFPRRRFAMRSMPRPPASDRLLPGRLSRLVRVL